MGAGLLDRIRGSGVEQEREDEEELIAARILAFDRQIKSIRDQVAEGARDLAATKKMVADYIKEQRGKTQELERAVIHAIAKVVEAQEATEEAHCPSCEAANPPTANFCDRCGAQLS